MLQGYSHDTRTDWWSFGCLLFEWANGRRAFDGVNEYALFKAIVEEDVKINSAQDFKLTALEVHRRCAQVFRRYEHLMYDEL